MRPRSTHPRHVGGCAYCTIRVRCIEAGLRMHLCYPMLYPYALILPVGSFFFTLHVVVSLSVLDALQSHLLPLEQQSYLRVL